MPLHFSSALQLLGLASDGPGGQALTGHRTTMTAWPPSPRQEEQPPSVSVMTGPNTEVNKPSEATGLPTSTTRPQEQAMLLLIREGPRHHRKPKSKSSRGEGGLGSLVIRNPGHPVNLNFRYTTILLVYVCPIWSNVPGRPAVLFAKPGTPRGL